MAAIVKDEQPQDYNHSDVFSSEELLRVLEELDTETELPTIVSPHNNTNSAEEQYQDYKGDTLQIVEPISLSNSPLFDVDDGDSILHDVLGSLTDLELPDSDLPIGEDLVDIFDDNDNSNVENIDPLPTGNDASDGLPNPDEILDLLDNLRLQDDGDNSNSMPTTTPPPTTTTESMDQAQAAFFDMSEPMVCVPCDGPAPPPPPMPLNNNVTISLAAALLAAEEMEREGNTATGNSDDLPFSFTDDQYAMAAALLAQESALLQPPEQCIPCDDYEPRIPSRPQDVSSTPSTYAPESLLGQESVQCVPCDDVQNDDKPIPLSTIAATSNTIAAASEEEVAERKARLKALYQQRVRSTDNNNKDDDNTTALQSTTEHSAQLAESYQNRNRAEEAAFAKEQVSLLQKPLPDAPPPDPWPTPAEMLAAPLLDDTTAPLDYTLPPPRLSQRPGALQAAEPFLQAFGATLTSPNHDDITPSRPCSRERQAWGHKERILGAALSPDGRYLATASQDSTVRVWCVATHRPLAVLREGSQAHELLRVAWDASGRRLAGGGADGVVRIWEVEDATTQKSGQQDPYSQWKQVGVLEHKGIQMKEGGGKEKLSTIGEDDEEEEDGQDNKLDQPDEDGPPQIYSLQFIEDWRVLPNDAATPDGGYLLTSSDDFVHLYALEDAYPVENSITTTELFSLHFGDMNAPGYGVTIHSLNGEVVVPSARRTLSGMPVKSTTSFGGAERNPNNIVFVFDASYSSASDLLGVALSDGSLRIMNSRGVCLAALSLPGCQSHLTSFCWDQTGSKILTTVATGHIIVWGIEGNDSGGTSGNRVTTCCRAIFQGGHMLGRPVYGACFVANDELVLSWGSDGRLCLWDGNCDEELDAPLALLRDYQEDYPIYCVAASDAPTNRAVVMAGGASNTTYVGVPVYLVDLKQKHASPCDGDDPTAMKRPKTE